MSVMRRICLLLLCLAVCACVLPAAFAEEGGELITAFADLGEDAVVETEFQYALIELEKLFPRQITVYCGDEARSIDVSWKCLENYSERRDEYHFAPRLDGYRVSSEAKPPQITVVVLGEWEIPPLLTIPSADDHVPPILGAPGTEKALPASYNAYERNLLPPIRDQNPYGTCWAHATIGAIEADLIRDGNAGTDIDLSELHLVYYYNHNYYDEKGCNAGDSVVSYGEYLRGGSIDAAANLLVNQVGPAAEADVPYYLNYDYNPGPADGRALNAVQVTGVYKMNIDDRAAVKNAIMKHGAVTATYYADRGECYDATYNSYYSTLENMNHGVLLVGWDDSFSRDHFAGSTRPEGNGAWLVRNSWGYEGYGLSGYFWLSYYDVSLHSEATAIAFDAQPWTYDHCYAYDSIPTYSWYTFSYNAEIEETFQVDGGETISTVGICTDNDNLNLEVTVSCGGQSASGSVRATYPGFYMVELSEPLRIESRSPVLVTVGHDADEIRVLIERSGWMMDYTGATVLSMEPGCGSGGFTYGGGYTYSYDARIKLFTMDTEWIPDLILPAELTAIGEGAFAGGAFTYVRLSEKTASIGKNAFANCPNLAYIYIPTATRSIDAQAFGSSEGLTVLGHTGSYAETYAEDHGFTFMPVA